ncbi:MAG: polysaccharide deacetylase family protein [Bacillota bacterium]
MYWSQKQLSKLIVAVLLATIFGIILQGVKRQELIVTTMQVAPIYRGDFNKKAVSFTFNVDWGEETIPALLEVLRNHNVKATFFVTGRWARKNPELIKKIYAQGHQIENHGYSHPHADRLSKQDNKSEIEKTEKIIFELTQHRTKFFAPPYGEKKPHVVSAAWELGYRTIMWTIDTIDWHPSTSEADFLNRIKGKTQNGAIILMHPKPVTVKALPALISYLKQEGYDILLLKQIVEEP